MCQTQVISKHIGRIGRRSFDRRMRIASPLFVERRGELARLLNELDKVNTMRNRIAHHEPVCFYLQDPVIDTSHVLGIYLKMQRLFAWMGIDSRSLLYGLDHVQQVCKQINELRE